MLLVFSKRDDAETYCETKREMNLPYKLWSNESIQMYIYIVCIEISLHFYSWRFLNILVAHIRMSPWSISFCLRSFEWETEMCTLSMWMCHLSFVFMFIVLRLQEYFLNKNSHFEVSENLHLAKSQIPILIFSTFSVVLNTVYTLILINVLSIKWKKVCKVLTAEIPSLQ